ncbi:MAG: hypothetical protein H6Q91_1647 [Deltaproteobacteria bacterium]|nr:hypothetical protein [Deltaproteobacteria bacterium]
MAQRHCSMWRTAGSASCVPGQAGARGDGPEPLAETGDALGIVPLHR